MKITIGTDPELMLFDKQSSEIVSAIPVIARSKYDPKELSNGSKCYYDNTLIEFSVNPARNETEFVSILQQAFSEASASFGNQYEMVAKPSHMMSKKDCEHKDAIQFGCSEEFCAYDLRKCEPPEAGGTFRSGGGHIHIGRDDYKEPSSPFLIKGRSKVNVIKMMDLVVGVPFTGIESNDPAALERKKLYGRAGRHRPTPYGVEYRVLSNYWVKSPVLAKLAYKLSERAVEAAQDASLIELMEENQEAVRQGIDIGNTDSCMSIFRKIAGKDLCKQVDLARNQKIDTLNKEWAIN